MRHRPDRVAYFCKSRAPHEHDPHGLLVRAAELQSTQLAQTSALQVVSSAGQKRMGNKRESSRDRFAGRCMACATATVAASLSVSFIASNILRLHDIDAPSDKSLTHALIGRREHYSGARSPRVLAPSEGAI